MTASVAPAIRPWHDAVFAAIAILAVAWVGLASIYVVARRAQVAAVQKELLQLATTLAAQMDGDLHHTIRSDSQAGSPGHLQALEPLVRTVRSAQDLIYAYTATLDAAGQIVFILHSDYLHRVPGDTLPVDPIGLVYPGQDPELREALTAQRPMVNAVPVTEKSGRSYMSAFAPFHDRAGKFSGVVGVDMWTRVLDARLATLRSALLLSGSGVAMLALAGGFVVLRLRRNAARQQLAIATALADEERSARAAEAASRAKSAFLANMSHELRTPLNAVLGYAQIMRGDTSLSPDHRRRLEAIIQGGEHLLGMINEVLDLSKIEADRIELRPRPTSLPRLLAALTEMFQLRATQGGLAFGFHQATPLPETVLADEGRLRQVLINLLENAIKFTPAGGRIDLEVGRQDERIRFSIRDSGVGIEATQLQEIFQPFHQAPAHRQTQGAGLGLAISQRLVGLMGGTIEVRSEPRRGSCFTFAVALPDSAPSQSAHPFGVPPTGYRGARRHILVVDDEPTNRRVLREMLEPLGFSVTEAENGRAAVAVVRQAPPDLVLMDIRMPEMDGFSATEEIRRLTVGRAVKIAAVSASVFSSDREEALARGCDEFLPKPFREAQLFEVIGRLLQVEWIAPNTPPTLSATSPGSSGHPPREKLRAVAALAEEGDVAALRQRIAALRQEHPGCHGWLDRIDALAAGFQMIQVGTEIARLPDENHPAR